MLFLLSMMAMMAIRLDRPGALVAQGGSGMTGTLELMKPL
jgi:hypothetical protein